MSRATRLLLALPAAVAWISCLLAPRFKLRVFIALLLASITALALVSALIGLNRLRARKDLPSRPLPRPLSLTWALLAVIVLAWGGLWGKTALAGTSELHRAWLGGQRALPIAGTVEKVLLPEPNAEPSESDPRPRTRAAPHAALVYLRAHLVAAPDSSASTPPEKSGSAQVIAVFPASLKPPETGSRVRFTFLPVAPPALGAPALRDLISASQPELDSPAASLPLRLGTEYPLSAYLDPLYGRARGPVEFLPSAPPLPERVRGFVRERFSRALTVADSKTSRFLLPALVFGARPANSHPLYQAFRRSGLVHIICVSGLHVGVVAALVGTFPLPLSRRLRVGVSCTLLASYLALLVVGPSVQRAAFMGAITLLGTLWGRRADAEGALAASVTCLLFWDLHLATSLGFALSVFATAAVIWTSGPARRLARQLSAGLKQKRPRRLLAAAIEICLVTLAAQAACLPLLVSVGAPLPLYGIFANLALAPLVPLILLVGLSAGLLALASPLASGWFLWFCSPLSDWAVGVARLFSALPGASLPWAGGPAGAISLILVLALGVYVLRYPTLKRYLCRAHPGARHPGRHPVSLPSPCPAPRSPSSPSPRYAQAITSSASRRVLGRCAARDV